MIAIPLAAMVIAPTEERSLPSILLFTPSVIAPGYASKVPFIVLAAPIEIAPCATQ